MCNVSRGPTELIAPMSYAATVERAPLEQAEKAPGSAPRADSDRLVFLDALRLIAAVQMVQGHSLDAVLATAYRRGAGFALWSFTRGLTSTAFLLAAGLAFALVSADPARFVRGRGHRVRRALMLVGIGYAMHAPFGLFVGQAPAAAWAELGIVDVLQCIGVGLLALETLTSALSAAWARGAMALCGCAVLFACAPALNGLTPQGFAWPLLNYLTARGGSIFPLSPWLGFLFAGFAVGNFVMPAGLRTPRAHQLRGLCVASASALTLAAFAHVVFGLSDPRLGFAFQFLKLGLVLGFSALLVLVLFRVSRLPRLLTRLSAETLFLYVSHVVVLYGAGIGLQARIGPTQSLSAALALALVLLLVCSGGALAYRQLRNALRAR